jgi:hypothetical protein
MYPRKLRQIWTLFVCESSTWRTSRVFPELGGPTRTLNALLITTARIAVTAGARFQKLETFVIFVPGRRRETLRRSIVSPARSASSTVVEDARG